MEDTNSSTLLYLGKYDWLLQLEKGSSESHQSSIERCITIYFLDTSQLYSITKTSLFQIHDGEITDCAL